MKQGILNYDFDIDLTKLIKAMERAKKAFDRVKYESENLPCSKSQNR